MERYDLTDAVKGDFLICYIAGEMLNPRAASEVSEKILMRYKEQKDVHLALNLEQAGNSRGSEIANLVARLSKELRKENKSLSIVVQEGLLYDALDLTGMTQVSRWYPSEQELLGRYVSSEK